MNRRLLKVFGVVLGILAFAALALYIATNSAISLRGSSLQNGEATVETDMPNATCKKVVKLAWPPVRLECQEKADD